MAHPPGVELVHSDFRPRRFRAALFDFDGTISLLREGWPDIMVGMMVDHLVASGLAPEPRDELRRTIDDFVMALNGRPTLVQMARFADEIQNRGGTPADPAEYGAEYRRRLLDVVGARWAALKSKEAEPTEWVVPNAHGMLESLQRRGVALYLASGSELAHVVHEAELLDVARHFRDRLHAPEAGDPAFSKRQVIERLLVDQGIAGDQLLGFGDGDVETAEVNRVGGLAVGVASQPRGARGVHPGKRARLIAAGAAVVISDYQDHERLLSWLFAE